MLLRVAPANDERQVGLMIGGDLEAHLAAAGAEDRSGAGAFWHRVTVHLHHRSRPRNAVCLLPQKPGSIPFFHWTRFAAINQPVSGRDQFLLTLKFGVWSL